MENWSSPQPASEADPTGSATFFSVTRPAYQVEASTKAGLAMSSLPSAVTGWVPDLAIGRACHWKSPMPIPKPCLPSLVAAVAVASKSSKVQPFFGWGAPVALIMSAL